VTIKDAPLADPSVALDAAGALPALGSVGWSIFALGAILIVAIAWAFAAEWATS